MGEEEKGSGKNRETYFEKNGTTQVGDALRWLTKAGKLVGPELLTLAGVATGHSGLTRLGEAIRGDSSLSSSDKEYLLKKLELDMVEAKQVTKRWEADMKSDHWLPKLIRPLVVANFTLLIDVVVISSMWGRPLGESYLPLLMTMGVTAIGGYFTLREYGKSTIIKNK